MRMRTDVHLRVQELASPTPFSWIACHYHAPGILLRCAAFNVNEQLKYDVMAASRLPVPVSDPILFHCDLGCLQSQ